MKASLSLSLIASIAGRGLTTGLMFLFTPIYLRLLGIEAYGLIGFYASVLACSMFLDQALSPMVAHRFAQSRAGGGTPINLWNAFRTVETLVFLMAFSLGVLIFFVAPWLASDIVRAPTLGQDMLLRAFHLMALLIFLQWPSFFYGAALAGLSDQSVMNTLRAAVATLQWAGGAAILAYIVPSIEYLFYWHAICLLLQGWLLRRRVVVCIQPGDAPSTWDQTLLREGWRFSSGTLLIGITGTILTQADKLLVAKIAPLSEFATYSLSFTVASIVAVFVAQPVMAIAFPHFTQRATSDSPEALSREYRRWTQLIVLAIVPVVGALVFHTKDILAFWLGSGLADMGEATRYIPWIALGTMLNVLMMLPFNLQLAHGWSGLSARKNLVVLPFFLAALWYGIPQWGPIMGAWAWFGLNLTYYLLEVPLMHSRILQATLWNWWLWDTALPCISGLFLFWVMSACLVSWAVIPPLVSCVLSMALVAMYLLVLLPASRKTVLNIWDRIITVKPI
jgi:O-antigen/teichoic acid export membrane protein